MFILNKSQYPIGLDISDLSLKLVQLNKIGDKIKIQAIGERKIPSGLIVDGEIKKKKEVIKEITSLVENPDIGKISTDEVIACLPESKTFLKMIEIESSEPNIEQRIRKEISKNIPLPLENLYYDWQIIEDLARRKLILIGAAPKNLVDQYIEVLQKANLCIVSLESEPVSICRSLLKEEHFKYKGDRDKNYAILDIGATNACLTVYSKNTILFTVSMPISGEGLTKNIAETLEISRDKAEKKKIDHGTGKKRDDDRVKRIFSKMINNLIDKNKKAIKYYNNHFTNWGPIDKIFLCGGVSNIKGLDEILAKHINIPVEKGNALTNIDEKRKKLYRFFQIETKKKMKKNKKEDKDNKTDKSSIFSTAIGLALRGIFIQ